MADPIASTAPKPFVTNQSLEQRVKSLEEDIAQLKSTNAHLFEKEKEEEGENPKKDGVITGD